MRRPCPFFVVLMALPCAALAEEPTATNAEPEFETVVVSDPYDPGGTSLRHMRRADLDVHGTATAADALERTPSVNASSGTRGERILTVRGFEQRQTAVLVDGAPVFVPYDGQVNLGALPAAMLERVVVSRSPGSIAAGPTGLGGAVSLTTRAPGRGPLFETELDTGLGGALRFGVRHSARQDAVAYSLYAGGDTRDGVPLSSAHRPTGLQPGGLRLNSDRDGFHAGGALEAHLGANHRLRLSATWMDSSFGVPPSLEDAVPRFWRFDTWRALLASATHASSGEWQLEQTAYARVFDNVLNGYDDATYSSQATPRSFSTRYDDRSFGLVSRATRRFDTPLGPVAARGWASAEYDRHSGGGEPVQERLWVLAAPEAELLLGERLTLTAAVQLEAEIPLDLPGESSRTALGAGPLVGARYDLPSQRASVGVVLARRHRFPSLKERFSRAWGYREPNPELGPESAWHVDLEGSWHPLRWLSLDLSLFDAETSGLIERAYLGEGVDQMQNIGRARFAGTELSVRLRPVKQVRAEIGHAFLHARRLSGDEARLAYRPTHKLSAGLVATPFDWLELATLFRLVGSQHYEDPNSLRWGTLGSYSVWDASVAVRPIPELRVIVRSTNLLDASYQTEFGFPDPGRQFWAGVRIGYDPPAL